MDRLTPGNNSNHSNHSDPKIRAVRVSGAAQIPKNSCLTAVAYDGVVVVLIRPIRVNKSKVPHLSDKIRACDVIIFSTSNTSTWLSNARVAAINFVSLTVD